MRAKRGVAQWRLVFGALAVTALALGVSLQSVAVPPSAADRAVDGNRLIRTDAIASKAVAARGSADSPSRASRRVATGAIPQALSVMDPIVVDYRDDEASRLRRSGDLVGALPLPMNLGGVAAGECSFDIECADCDPCTLDTCSLQGGEPAGTGKCSHTPIPDGQAGDCDDGLYCNGEETCQSGVCGVGSSPCEGGEVCSEHQFDEIPEDNRACHAPCSSNAECDDGLLCNGTETCNQDGSCEPGQNPCGPGADCDEKRCSGGGPPIVCASDADCPSGRTCQPGPVCYLGRCCNEAGGGAYTCAKQRYAPNSPACSGVWYSGNSGQIAAQDACPTCPLYTSGIAAEPGQTSTGPYLQEVGPISASQAACDADVPLNSVGDDYEMAVGAGQYFALDTLRVAVRMPVPDFAAFEFYDDTGAFIEDIFFAGIQQAVGIYVIEFRPNLTIPTKGFIAARTERSFNPNSELIWLSTDVAEAGINDSNVMWLNGAPTSNFLDPDPGVLAFELAGELVDPPTSACCNSETQACDSVVPWICAGRGDVALRSAAGDPLQCATCDGGLRIGENCRTCDAGANAGLLCLGNDDCPGGACVADDSQCLGDGGGIPDGVCSAVQACDTGACCNPTSGECSMTAGESECQTGGGDWMGYGTDCEPDCCPQPMETWRGVDNCEDVDPIIITVGDPQNPPAVQYFTMTGDNSDATSTIENPDSCFQAAEDVASQLGWWEAFNVDDCAYVRLDMCCTDPVHRPGYRIMYDSCPCGPAVFARTRPDRPDLEEGERGAPFCAEDNLWGQYGPLKAGTYYYPIYSDLAGHLGQYQVHLSVEACPRAACCVGGDCQLLNTLECTAAAGVFLAPPNKYPAVGACIAGVTCATGSCCTGPGECVDSLSPDAFEPVTSDDCGGGGVLDGNFVPGLRCAGGFCAGGENANQSCNSDDDCPNSTCTGDESQLGTKSPCPICQVEGTSNCQPFEDDVDISLSEMNVNGVTITTADDFIPLGDSISTVCVWGHYVETIQETDNFDCSEEVAGDHFRVRVYEDNGNALPDDQAIVGESAATAQKAHIPGSQTSIIFANPLEAFGYQLTLDTPITGLVNDGRCYWLEVVNDLTDTPDCIWFWQQTSVGSTHGNKYSAAGFEGLYGVDAQRPFDQAFCLDTDFLEGCGDPQRSCCACDGVCSVTSVEECVNNQGRWDLDNESCVGVSCPAGAPENDNCADLIQPITSVPAGIATNNFCATTDGQNPVPSDFGLDPLGADLWYSIRPENNCFLSASMCRTGTAYDSMMAMYVGAPGGDCPCPDNPGTHAASFIEASDESCTFAPIGGPGFINVQAEADRCYVIRVGGWQPGDFKGIGAIDISCPGAFGGGEAPDPLAGDPSDADSGKNRYLSFSAPASATAGASEEAIRITLDDVAGFGGFNGEVRFVGEPQEYTDEGLGTFIAAPLQCGEPFFTDWSGFDLINVYGAEIVPGSSYTAQRADVSCSSLDDEGCFSTALTIETAKWGDVAPTYFAPGGPAQPDFGDISALVDKFTAAPTSPPKARAQLQPKVPKPQDAISFTDIANCIDAFTGAAFPYAGPSACP